MSEGYSRMRICMGIRTICIIFEKTKKWAEKGNYQNN